MPDIFISYARSTEGQAKQIAEALRGLGYGVWRDDELPAHRAYAEVIEERLRSAKAVVVMWSAEAAKSQWVRAEANIARAAGTLVQLRLDATVPPLPFAEIQCADLAGWAGDLETHDWKKVVASVAELIGGIATPLASSPAVRKLSICVLPFANISGDPEQEYFSDGISEDIITDLSKVSALFVVARNTAFTFKGKSVEMTEVARKLGVSHLLEGSVRKAGNRLRITAQLIDGASGGHVWAERWDRDLTDIFALQDEISQAIVGALKIRLLPEEKAAIETRGTQSPEAYDLYLMAREYLMTGNIGDPRVEESIIRLCGRAIEIDPGFARAWALMAWSQGNLAINRGRGGDNGLAAAERAEALDPQLGSPYAVRALVLYHERRVDEAFAELERAFERESDDLVVNWIASAIYYSERRFEVAARLFDESAVANPVNPGATGMLCSSLAALGDEEGARAAAKATVERAEKILVHDRSNGNALGFGVGALAVLGELDRARQWISRALLIDADNMLMRYNMACALARHDPDGALELLAPAMASEAGRLFRAAATDPDLAPLHDDPRFQNMLAAAEARLAAAKPADGTEA